MYEIPCSCGTVETKRRLETRIKEHRDACVGDFMDRSAIAEHAWTQEHRINWNEVRMLDCAVREEPCIRMTPGSNRLNHDEGYEMPGCWIATMKELGRGAWGRSW